MPGAAAPGEALSRPFPGARAGPGASRTLGGSSSGAHRLPAPGLSIMFCPSSFFPQPRPVLTSHLLSHGIQSSHLKSGALCWVFKDSDLWTQTKMYIEAQEIPLTVVQIPFIANISWISKPRSWGTAVPLTRRSQGRRNPQKQVE